MKLKVIQHNRLTGDVRVVSWSASTAHQHHTVGGSTVILCVQFIGTRKMHSEVKKLPNSLFPSCENV